MSAVYTLFYLEVMTCDMYMEIWRRTGSKYGDPLLIIKHSTEDCNLLKYYFGVIVVGWLVSLAWTLFDACSVMVGFLHIWKMQRPATSNFAWSHPPGWVAVLEWTFFLPLATNSWTSKITNLLGQESSTDNKLSWNVCRCASICLFCGHLRSKVCGFLGPCWVCRRCTFEFEQYPYLGDLQPVKKAVPWRIVHFVARWCYPQRLSMFVMVYRPGWS